MAADIRWVMPEKTVVPDGFQAAIGGHPLVAETLYQRGIHSIEAARAFLDPEAYLPTPPGEMPDVDLACSLLAGAIEAQETILVWGDFDVDGQTATAVLVEGLRWLGAHVRYHIPVRASEPHGIHKQALAKELAQGFDLLLTCDTGITEHESLQILRNLAIPVIVTDHHILGESLPPAHAVINPQRLLPGHPLRTLPGVGVAYKLIEGLAAYVGCDLDLGALQELVALGVVADMAELHGDTRYLLQNGLRRLRETGRVGLRMLYQNADLNPSTLDEGHIGFQIAPRLNAVGRLGDANPMVELLTTADTSRARQLANLVEGLNIKRRSETRNVEQGALKMLAGSSADRHAPAIVLHHPAWPAGVVGIVANRLVERYQKPAILLTGEDPIHGSARSVPGVNITRAIAAQADLLNGYGGHPMAAGLSLPARHLNAFKRRFYEAVEDQLQGAPVVREIHITREAALDQLDMGLVEEIERLGPFGPGNPPLLFLLRDLRLVSGAPIGVEGEHRQVQVIDREGNALRLVWWNGGDEPLPEAAFDLVCKLSRSDYKGTPQLSAEWVDFRLSEAGVKEIEKRHVEIIDWREVSNPHARLARLIGESPDALVWGEGDLPEGLPFLGRHALQEAPHLVIWTAPPAQSVLRSVMERVQPQRVTVVGFDPNLDDQQRLMNRLAGAARYVVSHLGGETQLERLAAACASTEQAVQIGLLLWQAHGKLEIGIEQGRVRVSIAAPAPDLQAAETYRDMLTDLLDESRAYRGYFRRVDLHALITE